MRNAPGRLSAPGGIFIGVADRGARVEGSAQRARSVLLFQIGVINVAHVADAVW
mgnify:CR=1 FL=1